MKRVFISHPTKTTRRGTKAGRHYLQGISGEDDILPISPLHLFSFMEDDLQREEILQVCSGLLTYAMRFGYTATAKVQERKGLCFSQGKMVIDKCGE